jgi:hypothetical protein
MTMARSLTAEGAEFLAEVAEKNALRSSAKTSASSAVKIHGATSYSGFGTPFSQ